jgi:hypothetical protein
MARLPRVTDVEHLGQRRLRVTFTDGLVRELDFAGTLDGVLATLDDDRAFAEVSVDATAGTICWPNGIDVDPDVLHGDHQPANGRAVTVIREYRLQQAG